VPSLTIQKSKVVTLRRMAIEPRFFYENLSSTVLMKNTYAKKD